MRTERSVLRYAAVLLLGLAIGTALEWRAPVVHATPARLGIRHRFVSPRSDGLDLTQVQPSNWNDEHILDVLGFGTMPAPSAPIDGDFWIEASGTSPTRVLAGKVRDNGVTRTVFSITY